MARSHIHSDTGDTMLHTMKARLAQARQQEEGFTLIELMVVVLIIAILLVIAIPAFLGAQNKAHDRTAQSSVKNSLTNAKGEYADDQSYVNATVATLNTAEPSITHVAGPSTGGKSVSLVVGGTGNNTITLA